MGEGEAVRVVRGAGEGKWMGEKERNVGDKKRESRSSDKESREREKMMQ